MEAAQRTSPIAIGLTRNRGRHLTIGRHQEAATDQEGWQEVITDQEGGLEAAATQGGWQEATTDQK